MITVRQLLSPLLLLAVVACGNAESDAPSLTTTALSDLGACPSRTAPVKSLPLGERLVSRGGWVEVHSIDAGEPGESPGLIEISGDFEVIGGDADGLGDPGSEFRSGWTDAPLLQDMKSALALGAEVVARTGNRVGDTQAAPDNLTLAFAFLGNDFAALGYCQAVLTAGPFEAHYGPDAAGVIRSRIVGAHREELANELRWTEPRSPTNVTLGPAGNAPPEVNQLLQSVWYQLAPIPETWEGPYTVCPRISYGWGDCTRIGDVRDAVYAYFDPANPIIEFWLLDENARLANPYGLLGSVDLRRLDGAQSLRETDVVELRLSSRVGPDDISEGKGTSAIESASLTEFE